MRNNRFAAVVGAVLLLCVAAHDAQAFYNPSTGRWLSRDPIEEQGGLNLYAFCNNAGYTAIDFLGLAGCGEAIGKNGKPRYIFTPQTGGWKGVIALKDKIGSAQATSINKIITTWKADVTVLCKCSCGIRHGTRLLVYVNEGSWLEYDPISMPLFPPIVTSVMNGIGKLVAAGIQKIIIGNSLAVSPQSEIDQMIKTINSNPAPTTPLDGGWEGDKSPCDK